MRTLPFALLTLALLLSSGCGGEHKFVSVSGRITMGGKPVVGAAVTFQPIGATRDADTGPGSVGLTDQDGRYTLHSQLDNGQSGAVIGKHKVRIAPGTAPGGDADAADPKQRKASVQSIPSQYNTNSNLEFDVPADGTDQANFDLTPAGGTPKGP